ncbi:MAG TPA: diguanylate cyclase [Burkholderiales bacterium]|nr:diguanylate cyclase [Burkholderiales bacterium]
MSTPAATTLAGRIRAAFLAVTLLAILVVTLGAMAIGYRSLRAQMHAHLRTLAVVTATQSQAALLFKDRRAAEDVLRAIPADEGVVLAELRDASGAVVARIAGERQSAAGRLISTVAQETARANVIVDSRMLGSITLETDGEPLARALLGLLAYDLLGALVTGAVVLVMARRLAHHITQSLTELGTVIHRVREKRDFSRRAPPCGIAEIEDLRTDFHALLDEIQRRDADLRSTNAALKRLALRDALTGLPNRAMFERSLLDALNGGACAGLLYFDIDSFKAVNDTLGHPVGDALLKRIAQRLRERLPAHAVPARIGGDEFVVLLAPAGSADDLRALAAEVQRALQAPLPIGAYLFSPGVSVGCALSGVDARDADELIQLADQAMYAAKTERRGVGTRTHWAELPASNEHAAPPRDAVAQWDKAMKTAREAVLFEK